jgi:hypothetical protein
MILSGKTKLILSLSSFAILIAVGLYAGYINDEARYHFNEKFFVVGKEWVELTPKKPIKCDLIYQRLVLTILTPYEIEESCMGCPRIKLKDGTLTEIECVLVGDDGKEYQCRMASYYLAKSEPIFEEEGDEARKPRKRSYRAVKLRSSSPLLCSVARLECTRPPWLE